MQKQCGQMGKTLMAAVLFGLSACATPQAGDRGEATLTVVLEAIKQNDANGKTGTLKGIGLLNIPPTPPVALDNGAITLIPSTPELEAALRAIHRTWQEGRRRPVSAAEFQAAFAVLDRHVRAVQALGERALVRFTETDDKGRFSFDAVPAGRWLLVTTMDSSVSTILWAIPGDVGVAETAQVLVGSGNILIEGRRAGETESSPR